MQRKTKELFRRKEHKEIWSLISICDSGGNPAGTGWASGSWDSPGLGDGVTFPGFDNRAVVMEEKVLAPEKYTRKYLVENRHDVSSLLSDGPGNPRGQGRRPGNKDSDTGSGRLTGWGLGTEGAREDLVLLLQRFLSLR